MAETLPRPDDPEEVLSLDDDEAGLAFLSLLERLRVIVLQDLAILQPDYPGLPFFSLLLFRR